MKEVYSMTKLVLIGLTTLVLFLIGASVVWAQDSGSDTGYCGLGLRTPGGQVDWSQMQQMHDAMGQTMQNGDYQQMHDTCQNYWNGSQETGDTAANGTTAAPTTHNRGWMMN
jgi:hypothetical protein